MNEAITKPHSQELDLNSSQSLNLSETIFKIYQQAVSHSFEALEHFIICSILYAIACQIVYLFIIRKWTSYGNARFPLCKRVLFVIAHPDDESMFFGPTIVSLTKRNDCQVYLLCLSNGLYFIQFIFLTFI